MPIRPHYCYRIVALLLYLTWIHLLANLVNVQDLLPCKLVYAQGTAALNSESVRAHLLLLRRCLDHHFSVSGVVEHYRNLIRFVGLNDQLGSKFVVNLYDLVLFGERQYYRAAQVAEFGDLAI